MSEHYNYLEQVAEDAKAAILEHMNGWEFNDREELEEIANNELWTDDSVTGNASGSYFFNAWDAEAAISHNWDLLEDAINEFGSDRDIISKGAEACDVIIRCYMLTQAIVTALDELEGERRINYPVWDGEGNDEE